MRASDLTFETRVRLNNGVTMPVLGFGTWPLSGPRARGAVEEAVRTGYRLIDTASRYGNETEVGEAVRACPVPREELFITSKLWSHEHGHDEALTACEQSLERLGLERLDLYLIHWPAGGRLVETWRAMIKLLRDGKVRAIGVSNFSMAEMASLKEATGVLPAVDQVELSPYRHDRELLHQCREAGIQVEAYSPLKSMDLRDPVLMELARKKERSPAQIVLRWCLQRGAVVLARSTQVRHMKENADIFGFTLEPAEMAKLDGLG